MLMKKSTLCYVLTLITIVLINSTIVNSEINVYYRKNDYFKYRVTGSVWIKADITETTLVDKSKMSSFIEYSKHIYYTKQYIYVLTDVGIMKYADRSYILVRGNKFISDIKIHFISESLYASPSDVLKNKSINYIDFLTCIRGQHVDLSMIRIDDRNYNKSFELVLKYKPQNLLTIPFGKVDTFIESCKIDHLLVYLNDDSLIIVDSKISSEYFLKNSLNYGDIYAGQYVDLKYDVLLRYFNGVLIYGSIFVYGNRSIIETESRESGEMEKHSVSRILYSIEIELVDTSVEEIPTWRSLRVDLTYLTSSENAFENGLTIFILIVIPIIALYQLYKKLVRAGGERAVKIKV